MRTLLFLTTLLLASGARGQADDPALGTWHRPDSTVAGENGEIRVELRQVEVTDSTVTFSSILHVVSGLDAGHVAAQRMTVARDDAEIRVQGDVLTLTDRAISVHAGAYRRAEPLLLPEASGVWAVPEETRGPRFIEITREGHVLAINDTLFTALAVAGPYVITTDQDEFDRAAFERGERSFQTFEVLRAEALSEDRLALTIPPEAVTLTRAEAAPEGVRGEWADVQYSCTNDRPCTYIGDFRYLVGSPSGFRRTIIWRDGDRDAGIVRGLRGHAEAPAPMMDPTIKRAVFFEWPMPQDSTSAVYRPWRPLAPEAETVGIWSGEMQNPETGAAETVTLRIAPEGHIVLLSEPLAYVSLHVVGPFLMMSHPDGPTSEGTPLFGGRVALRGDTLVWPDATNEDPLLILERQSD